MDGLHTVAIIGRDDKVLAVAGSRDRYAVQSLAELLRGAIASTSGFERRIGDVRVHIVFPLDRASVSLVAVETLCRSVETILNEPDEAPFVPPSSSGGGSPAPAHLGITVPRGRN